LRSLLNVRLFPRAALPHKGIVPHHKPAGTVLGEKVDVWQVVEEHLHLLRGVELAQKIGFDPAGLHRVFLFLRCADNIQLFAQHLQDSLLPLK